jgi:hypothetical protein
MERTEDHIEDALIDLGAVTVETQGPDGTEIEGFVLQPRAGISDE